MTAKEAIKMLRTIKRTVFLGNLKFVHALDVAIKALEAQDVARERYEDLCEYFNNNPHTIELILNDRKEFKAWLERMHWHVLECDKLARKLEALEGKDANVPSNDTISRQDAIDAVEESRRLNHHKDGKEACAHEYEHRHFLKLLMDLPPAQPEPLTDKEQRIFLAAMEREEKVCEEVDRNYVREPYEDSLMRMCKEIRRKVKGVLWT